MKLVYTDLSIRKEINKMLSQLAFYKENCDVEGYHAFTIIYINHFGPE
jgi:hypothetical protein